MLDRQHLAILREIDRLGSVTAAADYLNLTQSALSHTMRKFEERYGVKVWEKEGRGLRLTQTGHYLLALALRVLPQFEKAEGAMADFSSGQRGALRAGIECHPCQQWLMRVVAPYLTAWPQVDLDIRTAFRFGGIEALLAHEIDLLITPDPLEVAGIHYTKIFDYELVLAVPEAHAIGAIVQPRELTTETLITYPVSPERLDIFTRFLMPANCLPQLHRSVESTDMMLQLVAAGRGVSSVPDWILREEGQGLALRAAKIGNKGLQMALHIGVRTGEINIDYIQGFLDLALSRAVQEHLENP